MSSVLPLRFTLLKILYKENKALDPFELHEMIKNTYPNEKQATASAIDEHFMSMKGVGLVEVDNAYEKNNEIISRYKITDFGKERVKQYF